MVTTGAALTKRQRQVYTRAFPKAAISKRGGKAQLCRLKSSDTDLSLVATLFDNVAPLTRFRLNGEETSTASDFLTINQVDIVPTISLLLSLPIPFASIGSIAPNLLPNSTPEQTVGMLLLNCAQVHRYLKTYGAKDRKLLKKVRRSESGVCTSIRDVSVANSETACNSLRSSQMAHLEEVLAEALETLSEAIIEGGGDTIKMRRGENRKWGLQESLEMLRTKRGATRDLLESTGSSLCDSLTLTCLSPV